MTLLSLEFILFFLILFPLYWGVKKYPKIQNNILLIASLIFISCHNIFFTLAIVLFSLFINVISYGFLLHSNLLRKKLLILAISISIVTLSFFKYSDFFLDSFSQLGFDYTLDIIMPLGISYYVFQSIAYLIYLYKTPAENLVKNRFSYHELLLHLSFFPTITAGPIIRVNDFKNTGSNLIQKGALLQIRLVEREIINPVLAISLILLGIMKKWWFAGVIAENIVNPIFANPEQYDSFSVLMAIYGYTIQLFCDFSGYSDLVIGLAMLLGYQLPQNFNAPFLAKNLRDFWNRWHMSLSSWIRDYIYIPLGGSAKPFWRTQLNLMIAMVLSGVWHGSGINFLIWGVLHGLGLIFLNIMDKFFGKKEAISQQNFLLNKLSVFITFNFVCFTFVVFKLDNLDSIELIFKTLITANLNVDNLNIHIFLFAMILLLGFFIYSSLLQIFIKSVQWLENKITILWIVPIIILGSIIIFFAPSGIPGFIYANF